MLQGGYESIKNHPVKVFDLNLGTVIITALGLIMSFIIGPRADYEFHNQP